MRIHNILVGVLLLTPLSLMAQTITIYRGQTAIVAQADETSGIFFEENGENAKVGNWSCPLASIDSVVIDEAAEPLQEVRVAYAGATARVFVPLKWATLVESNVSGADVEVTSQAVDGEDIYYSLSGSSDNGSFLMNGQYKCRVILNGLRLSSQKGAAIDIQNGKRIDVCVNDGTENFLSDAENGLQKACFYVKGHPEFSGSGTLTVEGRTKHAIASKEYMRLKPSFGNLVVETAKGDAVHCGQYFQMDGGRVTVGERVLGDGIQAEITNDPADEMNGQMFLNAGELLITVNGDDVKALNVDSTLTITGGKMNFVLNGAGSRGIQCDGNLVVNEGTSATEITILAAGGVFTNPLDKTDTSKCMGIRVEGDMTFTAGKISVQATGKKAKTVKVVGRYTRTDPAVMDAADLDI